MIVQLDFALDKLARKAPYRGTDDIVQRAGTDDIIAAVAAQAQIGKRHLHILLHAPHLARQAAGQRGILVLQRQANGCDGRFDLMRPHGVVFCHVVIARVHIAFQLLPVRVQRKQQRLIGLLLADGARFAQRKQQYDPARRRAQGRGVQNGPQRQAVQRKGNRKDQAAEPPKEHAPALGAQIQAKKPFHILIGLLSYSTR